MTALVRRADVGDAAALTRLRTLMLTDMGMLTTSSDPRWRGEAEHWFAARLAEPDRFAAFVIDDPALGMICCAAGLAERHAPGPANPVRHLPAANALITG